jgi:hypothetical protein
MSVGRRKREETYLGKTKEHGNGRQSTSPEEEECGLNVPLGQHERDGVVED